MEIIEGIINGIIASYTTSKISELIIEKRAEKTKKNIMILIMMAIIMLVSYRTINNFMRMTIVFIVCIILNRYMYKERLEKSITVGFIEYINIFVAEIIVGFVLSIILKHTPNQSIEGLKNTILLNIVIMTTAYILAKTLRKTYQKVVSKIKNSSIIPLIFVTVLIVISIGSLFYKIEIRNWNFNSDFLLNTILIIVMGVVGILVILQRVKYEKANNEYKAAARYSEMNAGLLEDYSEVNHEHENQLIIIREMIENGKLEEALAYVNQLINKKVNLKYKWVKELNNLSFQILRCFMSSKILEMENKKIKVITTISKKCKKYKLEKLTEVEKDQLYSVVGVFMDNAMQAAEESRKKEVIIDGYEQDGKLYLDIANTFKGKVDIKRIHEYGYTSKGLGHGTGLHIVENITKKGGFIETNTKIQNKYFIQTLIIKI